MRTRIKICGITRVEDGVAAARAGADAIGLVFWPGTPRRVDVARARAIAAALPPLVSTVGLFVDPSADEVRAVLDAVPLCALQFHGHEDAALCRAFGRPYLKAIPVGAEGDLLESLSSYGDAGTHATGTYWLMLTVFIAVFVVGTRAVLARTSRASAR